MALFSGDVNMAMIVLAVAIGIILLYMAFLSLRNPIVAKLGVRNIPRRPAQTALIVAGLTLSTIIIVSSLSTGDTLDYSVERHAVNAYGEIDEIVSPPLLTVLAGLEGSSNETAAVDGENSDQAQAALDLSGTGYDTLLNLLSEGLPGISNERYQQLRDQAEQEPLIDGVAPSIVFPTIIRNVSSGQGEPLGFIFAVDSQYDQKFGLHNVDGQPVSMEALDPGVGNIFQTATDLFVMAGGAAKNLGIDLQLSDVATAVAAAGALASGDLSSDQLNSLASAFLGQDAGSLLAQTGITDTTSLQESTPLSTTMAALPQLNTSELLSAVNLNTLGTEIDRVLGQFGLQLRQGDIYLNRLGAEQLDAEVGDVLEIYLGPIPLPYRVKGIVNEAGPMGALMPVVMMRLDEAQQLLSPVMPGQVNAILVSNQGDPLEGLKHTADVSERLRVLALDEAGVEKVAAILRRPDVLSVLESEAANADSLMPSAGEAFFLSIFGDIGDIANTATPNAEQIRALPEVLARNDVDALRSTLGNMANRSWLQGLPLDEETAEELNSAIQEMTPMEVLDPLNKQTIVAASGIAGTAFSTVFSIFGIFSIMAGVLLIFMIFVMLAAERRSEMGMARAIGMQRGHLVQMFVSEGLLYDLAAALVGVVLGLGISYLMIDFLGDLFNEVSGQFSGQEMFFRFRFHVVPASVIIAYCLGVLFTFLIVTVSSYQVSRLNIVAAIRDLPDADNTTRRSRLQKIARGIVGPLLIAGGGYVIWLGLEQGLTAILSGVTLALIGAAFSADWALARTAIRSERRKRFVYTSVGLGMLAIWGVPWGRVLGDGSTIFQGNPIWVPLTFALGGPMLILGAILVVMFNADAWVWAVNRLLGGIGTLTPVLRTAVAYPLSSRFRTGMAMTMFAMVITTVVIMSIVVQATQTLVEPDAERSAGFDIQLSTTLLSFFDPINDLAARIEQAPDFPAEDVVAVGRYQQNRLDVRQVDSNGATWQRSSVSGLDAGYIDQASQVYSFKMRAPGFEDDAAVWQALQQRDDVAIVTANLVEPPLPGGSAESSAQTAPAGNISIDGEGAQQREDVGNGDVAWGRLHLAGIDPDAETLPETEVQVRNRDNGQVTNLQIIGVLAQRSTLAGDSVQVGQSAFEQISGEPLSSGQWYVKVREGVDAHAVAAALERSFLSSGMDATVLAESFAQGQQITRGILQLFQGFMALGLLVGIAALGVISSRTVVERRQQVGMLRAIGYQPGMVALSFVLESSFIALVGIGIGTATGVLLGRNMLVEFFDLIRPGSFTMPWLEIGGILLLAYLFSLITTILPAYQASRIYPAEALRYE